jgi:hypothetical protein
MRKLCKLYFTVILIFCLVILSAVAGDAYTQPKLLRRSAQELPACEPSDEGGHG